MFTVIWLHRLTVMALHYYSSQAHSITALPFINDFMSSCSCRVVGLASCYHVDSVCHEVFMLYCPLCTHPTVLHYPLPPIPIALYLCPDSTVYVMHVYLDLWTGITEYCTWYTSVITYLTITYLNYLNITQCWCAHLNVFKKRVIIAPQSIFGFQSLCSQTSFVPKVIRS